MTVSSIGSASRTYSTWQAWEDAFLAVLLAPQEGEAYIDNGTWFSVAGTVLTLAGVTTSSTNFVEARPATSQGFLTGMGASGPLRVDFTKGVGMQCTAGFVNIVLIQVDHVRMRGLQVAGTSTDADKPQIYQNTNSYSGTLIRDCIIESPTSADIGPYAGVLHLRAGTAENCCIINRSGGCGISVGYAGTVNLTNCTIVRPSDISAVCHVIRREGGGGTVTLTNCAGFGFSAFENGTDPTGSNNASDGTISFGTSNQASKTYANQFVTVTDAARDFRVKDTSADIYNTGTTGTTGDIIQQAANGTKDIGAWELQGAGPSGHPAVKRMGGVKFAHSLGYGVW